MSVFQSAGDAPGQRGWEERALPGQSKQHGTPRGGGDPNTGTLQERAVMDDWKLKHMTTTTTYRQHR